MMPSNRGHHKTLRYLAKPNNKQFYRGNLGFPYDPFLTGGKDGSASLIP